MLCSRGGDYLGRIVRVNARSFRQTQKRSVFVSLSLSISLPLSKESVCAYEAARRKDCSIPAAAWHKNAEKFPCISVQKQLASPI